MISVIHFSFFLSGRLLARLTLSGARPPSNLSPIYAGIFPGATLLPPRKRPFLDLNWWTPFCVPSPALQMLEGYVDFRVAPQGWVVSALPCKDPTCDWFNPSP